jgi:hypothetical protein
LKTIIIGALVAVITVGAVAGFLVLNSSDDAGKLTTVTFTTTKTSISTTTPPITTTLIKTVTQPLDEQPKP